MKVEVEFDWMDGNVDDQVLIKLAKLLSHEIGSEAKAQVQQKALDQMEASIDVRTQEIVDEMMNDEIVITDEYGNPKYQDECITVKDVIKKRVDAFVNSDRDERGNCLRQGLTRIENMIDEKVQTHLKKFVGEVTNGICNKYSDQVRKALSDKLAEQLLGTKGLTDLIEQLKENKLRL